MLIKCASEGICLRLGVGCLLLGDDEVRIRGNMFAFWFLGVDSLMLMKCASEGTCLSLGVCFGMINM